MNALAVFRRYGELLDPLLREAEPPRDANFAADTFFQRLQIFQIHRRHRHSPSNVWHSGQARLALNRHLRRRIDDESMFPITAESLLARRLQFSEGLTSSHSRQIPGAMLDPQLESVLRSEL